MAQSFFAGTEYELFTGSDNFSNIISADYASLGLTLSQTVAYAALNATWRDAYLTAKTPETRTKAAVAAKRAARKPLAAMASDLAKIIAGNSSVSDAARIELGLAVRSPGAGAPLPPPGTPDELRNELIAADGSLVLKWKCASPRRGRGVMYKVSRKVDGAAGQGGFEFLDVVGKRKFTDTTIPAGAVRVTYRIEAQRGTVQGIPATFTLQLSGGSAGAGAMAEMAA